MKHLLKCTKCNKKPNLIKQKNGKKFFQCPEKHFRGKKATEDLSRAMSRWNITMVQSLNKKQQVKKPRRKKNIKKNKI